MRLSESLVITDYILRLLLPVNRFPLFFYEFFVNTQEAITMYTMMQVCRELDMTYQTLKYYCNEGLVPNVKRDSNNRRVFDEKDVKWIKDLTCLKKCFLNFTE